jgi:hypothetical protein
VATCVRHAKVYLDVGGGRQNAKDDLGLDATDLEGARQAALSLLRNAHRASAASQYPVEKVTIRDDAARELMRIDRRDTGGDRHE